MNCWESTDQEKISALMEKARTQNSAIYLAGAAVICTTEPSKDIVRAENYTRGSFKRAVKVLRWMQKEAPQHAATYEDAITYIRTKWLHREVGTNTYTGQFGSDAGPAPGPGRRQSQSAGENRGELVG